MRRADEALVKVGLSLAEVRGRFPHELSGGQLQRVAVARALIPSPAIIVADEPVSMVDASLRMSIVNLFRTLRDDLGISIVYITHDLATAYYISDRIIIMQRGSVVESGDAAHRARRPATSLFAAAEKRGAVARCSGHPARPCAFNQAMEGFLMRNAKVLLDRDFAIGETDPRLFGAFVEHLGRCVYGGIYEPGHPTADSQGLPAGRAGAGARAGADHHALSRRQFRLRLQLGGRGRAGRRAAAPPRSRLVLDRAQPPSAPTNSSTGAAPPASSRCSRSISARAAPTRRATWSNTATTPGGTALSDLRRKHGWEKPHDIKFWCLGNEMDGPWQMEAKDRDRIRPHRRRGRQDDALDRPRIELAACGSSGRNMPTFGAWEDTVLEHTFDHVEFISLHTYLNNYDDDTAGLPRLPRPDGQFHRGGGGDRRCRRRPAPFAQAHHAELRRMECLVPHAPHARRPGQGRLAGGAADPRGDLQHGRMRWPSAAPASRCSTMPTASRPPAWRNSSTSSRRS